MPDDIIDEAAVRISPDLEGFRKKLEAALIRATKGVEAVEKVRLIANAKGWAGSVDTALKKHREQYGPRKEKVRLVADATGWTKSVERALRGEKAPTVKVDVDKGSTVRAAKNVDGVFKKIEGSSRVLADTINKRINKSLQDSFLLPGGSEPLTKALSRARSEREKFQSAELEAVDRVGKAKDKELGDEIARIGKHLHLQLSATKAESAAREGALDDYYRDLQRVFDFQRGASKAEAKRLAAEATEAERAASAARAEAIETQRKGSAFMSFQDKINAELHKMREDAADDELRIAREAEQAQHRIDLQGLTLHRQVLAVGEAADKDSIRRTEAAQKESVARRKTMIGSLTKASEANGIIDFGGRGIRPGNIPIAALLALSPALVSIASSATLASTSIAAIGSASIGAAAGVTALVVGFGRIREVLTLREQVRKEEARATVDTAESAAAERSRAQAIVQANRSARDSVLALADARRNAADAARSATEARAGINAAYKEAARYVKDLREELADLALQEQQDTIDVASAREKLADINTNYWATDLEKRQAALDLKKALDRQGDTKRERGEKREELTKLDTGGLGQSKQVLDAKERSADADRAAADAQRALTRAAEGVTDAQIRLTEAKRRDTVASGAASAASRDLAARVAAMSPAARDMYHWFVKNEGALDRLRSKMEQAVLPGFLRFLEAVTDTNKGKRESTLQIMADSAATLGGIIGDTVGELGVLTKSKWFRGDLATINTENEKSFRLLGKAALTLVRPFTRIIAASSPLFTKFSKWLLDIATRFDTFIEKAVKDGSLVQWFKDAGTELGKWGDIAGNLLSFLKDIFTTSLPTGKDLVSRIRDTTAALAAWSAKPENQKRLTDFFERFKNIDYGKLTKFVVQVGALIAVLKLATFGRKHPFYLLMAVLAKEYPEATATFMSKVAGAIGTTLGWINKHPVAAATTLAILTALIKAKSVSVGLNVLGLTGLASKFTAFSKIFGGTSSTGVMHVNAGVVHINGAAGVGGKDAKGAPTVLGGGNKNSKVPGVAGKGLGMGGPASVIAAGILAIDAVVYHPEKIKRFFTMDLPNWLVQGERGWSSFENATENTFGKRFVKWWSHDLPESLNLGEGTGWSGLTSGLGRWFSTTLPDAISGTPGGGWSGAGIYVRDQFKEFIGWNTVRGIWDGISEGSSGLWEKIKLWWKWLVDSTKSVLGIASPSTVFAEIGGNLVSGLWKGFTGKWGDLVDTVKAYIATDIGGPFKSAFKSIGEGVRRVFLAPFGTLTQGLAAPVGKALNWIDRNIIDKLNGVLSGIGITREIPNINSKLADPPATPPARTGMGSNPNLAAGGRVPGFSPNPRADNIHAMLTADEYVQPVDTVKHYGVGFMDKLRRKEIPRYAGGGLVGSMKDAIGGNRNSFVSQVAAGAIGLMGGNTIKAIAANVRDMFAGLFDGSGTPVGDINVARIAESTARNMGATNKQLLALIEAGIVESGMRNLNYGDRDSVGFLQQRAGWGSVAQRMDVAHATRSFVRSAKRKDRRGQTAGQLAQAVQVSAYPDRYDQREADAYAIINRELPGIFGAGPLGNGRVGSTWQQLWAAVKGRFPGAVKYSDVRPGDRTLSGNLSRHALGRAIDVNPARPIAQWIASNYGARTHELITPWRDLMLYRGKPYKYSAAIERQHGVGRAGNDHIHWAMANGGLVPNVPMRKYDSGGDLPPGATLAINGTGRTETVRTAAQEKAVSSTAGWRLDRRDLALLAQYICAASQRPIHMDGRKVAEIVHAYNYLPGGV